MLLYLMSAALAGLWMLDAFFTVHVLGKKGDKKETNELMRGAYRRGVFSFVAIKIIIMSFVLSALLILSKDYLITAESIMFIFIYIYARVDWHNYKIWKNRNSNAESTKRKRKVFKDLQQ